MPRWCRLPQLGAATVGDRVFAVGGYAAPGWNIVEYFDVGTSAWVTAPPLPTPRFGLACEALGTDLYAIGGSAYHLPAVATVEVLDTTTMTWSTAPSLTQPRAYVVSEGGTGRGGQWSPGTQ